ncbi:SpoIIE family protein phosphatase [Pseudofrankia sp. BMG5.36]|uniref:SpoIIE family protein phosphatase n=1 Tax=Pseudofrankia sp. BMG5.36 TaxID=1834512 RepID=UPI0008D92C4C|nr:SpoIIE family protein phosphatase [Pseudofrankia sp. BMG5.36]OHV42905.1 serine/threonine protein phosphatase [Pseudofrankia sp. BMG5.36]
MSAVGLDGRLPHHTITLPPAAESPRSARRFLLSALRGRIDEDTLDSALLLVTELVTNVVVHAGTPATVDVTAISPGELAVRVHDLHPVRIGSSRRGAGDGQAGGQEGGLGESGLGGLREDGRGLALVDALASSWGTEHGAGGKTVWFRLIGTTRTESSPGEPATAPSEPADNVISLTSAPAARSSPAASTTPARVERSPASPLAGPTQPTAVPTDPPADGFLPRHSERTCQTTTSQIGSADPAGTPFVDPAGTPGASPSAAPEPALEPYPRSPRIISRSTARALTAEGEVAELLAQLVDAQPVTGGLVHRPSPDDPEPEIVAALGNTGEPTDALSFPLDPTQDSLGEVLLWPDPAHPGHGGQPAAVDAERVRLVARWMALALGGGDMRQAEERRIGMLSFLAEASDLLAGSLELEHTLSMLAHLPVPRIGRWCAVYLRRDDGNPVLSAVAHAEEAAEPELTAAATDPAGPLLAAVRGAGTTPVRQVTTPDGPVLVAVLRARRRVLGVVAIGRDPGGMFAADEADLLADLARRAAFAVDNAKLYSRQVELADGLQAGLRPPVLPEIPGLDLGAAYGAARSAGLDVGGDFFDLMPGPDGWTVAIGDVCGKGAEAATVTGVARAVLRLLTGQATPVGKILVDLNRTLRDTATAYPHGQPRFCTMATASLAEPSEKGVRLTLHLAGHPQPVLLAGDGGAAYVGVPGTLLGVLDDDEVAFPSTDVELHPGDALVLYTDGVVEARSGRELLGEQRLLEAVGGCAGLSAQGVADRVRAAADRFAGGNLRDDIAIVVLRVPSQP